MVPRVQHVPTGNAQIRVVPGLEDELIRGIQKEKPCGEVQRCDAAANDGILARDTAEAVSAEEEKLGNDSESC